MAQHLSGLLSAAFLAFAAARWLRHIAPLTIALLIYLACFRISIRQPR
ncbi:MAG TPA: hypothetical protein VMM16_14125 [Verrucomicrobiae bacterium]|nr:hypothetical protein [Verrucomicrobiae bacterium]